MKPDKKIKQLFSALRQSPAPVPAPDFAGDVMRQLRREPLEPMQKVRHSVLDDLSVLLPKAAIACLAIVAIGFLAEVIITGPGGISSEFEAASQEWFIGL